MCSILHMIIPLPYLVLHCLSPPPESVELPPSSDGPPTKEWILVGMAELEQRKTDHGTTIVTYC